MTIEVDMNIEEQVIDEITTLASISPSSKDCRLSTWAIVSIKEGKRTCFEM